MNPITTGVLRRLRQLRSSALSSNILSSRVPSSGTGATIHDGSPYTLWHGPQSGSEPSLVATRVADIALLQGCAPAGSVLGIEIDGHDEIEIEHRFPHLQDQSGPAVCFEATIDASVYSGEARVRLVADGIAQQWIQLPELPLAGAMVGVDVLTTCPACRSGRVTTVGRRQHLTMVACGACGLVMTSPRPAEDHTLVRYSQRYFEDEYLPSQALTPALLAHIDDILDHAEPAKVSSNRLFELGVGGGNLAARAAARGWAVSGTDVNTASVEHVRGSDLNVWLENSDHAESLGGTYGAVISEMSLEHVRHPERFCSLAADALVPDGRLVIYTVSAEGASFEHAGMASPLVGPAEHLFLYSAGSLVALCQSVGLRVDTLWRNRTGDEIGIVAVKRRDIDNPAIVERPAT